MDRGCAARTARRKFVRLVAHAASGRSPRFAQFDCRVGFSGLAAMQHETARAHTLPGAGPSGAGAGAVFIAPTAAVAAATAFGAVPGAAATLMLVTCSEKL